MEDGGGGKEWQFSRHCSPHPVTRGLPVDSQPGGEGSDNYRKTNNRLRHPASELSRARMMETQVLIYYHSALLNPRGSSGPSERDIIEKVSFPEALLMTLKSSFCSAPNDVRCLRMNVTSL
ncbi:hypothetical protein TNIN_329251 [Trichonephila inaurata madagascariensis]|uniref:Uncharacterized protein n=1 Tax=Trichonephila inaurata madagascariensis TaxID=2747483 RepID=A0A8X6WSV4_9ARAC|nr:hypothetical protein TNIN_329251 [Trichonephila inaurata madagascariensis]